MDVLQDIYNHPVYKKIIPDRLILKKKVKIIRLTKELNKLISEHCISGKVVVNGYKSSHFKECSQAYIDSNTTYDWVDFCICSEIWRTESQITVLLEEINHEMNDSWFKKFKRNVRCTI